MDQTIAMKFQTKVDAQLVEAMRQGMEVITDIQIHWADLQNFLQFVSIHVKQVMVHELKDFVGDTNELGRSKISEDEMIDILLDQADRLSGISYSIGLVSQMYVHVSRKFIVPKMRVIYKLIDLDENERSRVLEDLRRNYNTTRTKIRQLSRDQQSKLEQGVLKHIKSLHSLTDELLMKSKPAEEVEAEMLENGVEAALADG